MKLRRPKQCAPARTLTITITEYIIAEDICQVLCLRKKYRPGVRPDGRFYDICGPETGHGLVRSFGKGESFTSTPVIISFSPTTTMCSVFMSYVPYGSPSLGKPPYFSLEAT